MKGKKLLSLLMCTLLAAGALGACGQGAGESGGESRNQSSEVKESSGTESQEAAQGEGTNEEQTWQVTLAVPVNGPVDEKNETLDYLNSLVPGLEFKIEAIEIGSYWDILNPRLASGEIPDIFHCHSDSMYRSYLEQGVLGGVAPELIKECMPEFVSDLKECDATGAWSLVLDNGLIYGLPIVTGERTYNFTNGWRMDWLKAVGIDKVPETVEEYEEAFTRFTFNDPDGNGVDDTYGTTLRGKDSTPNLFPSLFGAYGIFPGMWNLAEDGTLKFGITDPRGKEALEKLHSWYEKGLIDPEFISVDGVGRTEKWANSKVGALVDTTYYNLQPGDAIYDGLLALTPEAEVVSGPAPKGEDGDYGYMNWGRYTNRVVFGKTLLADEEKLKKVLQLYDLISTDFEVCARLRCGVEGTHWEYNEFRVPQKFPAYSDAANNGPSGLNTFWQGGIPYTPIVGDLFEGSNIEELNKYGKEGTLVNGENYFSYLGKFVPDEVGTAYKAEADTLYKTNFIDFITGARPLEEYDAFVEEWMAAGGEAYTKAHNECWQNIETIMAEAESIFN